MYYVIFIVLLTSRLLAPLLWECLGRARQLPVTMPFWKANWDFFRDCSFNSQVISISGGCSTIRNQWTRRWEYFLHHHLIIFDFNYLCRNCSILIKILTHAIITSIKKHDMKKHLTKRLVVKMTK